MFESRLCLPKIAQQVKLTYFLLGHMDEGDYGRGGGGGVIISWERCTMNLDKDLWPWMDVE